MSDHDVDETWDEEEADEETIYCEQCGDTGCLDCQDEP